MAVTTLEQLKQYSEGSEVELPGFDPDTPFIVRLKRPSLMILAQSGKIPNELLDSAAELFKRGLADSVKGGESFQRTAQTLVQIAKASLVSPSYEELEEAGIALTDMQLIYIYNFTQTGVNALKSFRKK